MSYCFEIWVSIKFLYVNYMIGHTPYHLFLNYLGVFSPSLSLSSATSVIPISVMYATLATYILWLGNIEDKFGLIGH